MTAQSIVLHNHRNGSDKVYLIELVEAAGGWVVNYRNGRRVQGSGYRIRGNAGGTRTRTPKPHDAALRIYRRLIREKLAEHYVIVEQTQDGVASGAAGDSTRAAGNDMDSGRHPMLPVPIDEETKALQLCDNPSYCAQEEENGARRMLLKEFSGEVRGIDRNGEFIAVPQVIRNTPRLIRASTFLVDGEQVGEILRVWDLLEQEGEDLREQSMQVRYERLCSLIPSYYNLPLRVVPTAFSRAAKLKMFEEIKARQGEGIVFKLVAAPYIEGTSKYALKHTFRSMAIIQVVGANPATRSIQMGVVAEEGIRFVGNLTIPPNKEMPSLGEFTLVEYLHVIPDTGALVQPAYLGPCADKAEADRYGLLKFKPQKPDSNDEEAAEAA